jgi:hypothetical protein
MPFTNTWDVNFPPDTQLANLLGQDIRNGVKVDVQQRMAAISGLDAAKPNFAGDAQPANWNGILFFATDTGKIYQFNNPAWTDITANLAFRNPAIKNTNVITQTGDTAVHAIYTVPISGGFLGTTGHLRITLFLNATSVGGPPRIFMSYGGIGITPSMNVASAGDYYAQVIGGNLGVTNSQSWDTLFAAVGQTGIAPGNQQHQATAIDSTVAQNLVVDYQGGINGDSITFFKVLVELM